MSTNDVLTVDEVAKELRLARTTVLHLIKRGTLRAAKLGRQWRIRRADLEACLAAVSQPSTA